MCVCVACMFVCVVMRIRPMFVLYYGVNSHCHFIIIC